MLMICDVWPDKALSLLLSPVSELFTVLYSLLLGHLNPVYGVLPLLICGTVHVKLESASLERIRREIDCEVRTIIFICERRRGGTVAAVDC